MMLEKGPGFKFIAYKRIFIKMFIYLIFRNNVKIWVGLKNFVLPEIFENIFCIVNPSL